MIIISKPCDDCGVRHNVDASMPSAWCFNCWRKNRPDIVAKSEKQGCLRCGMIVLAYYGTHYCRPCHLILTGEQE